MKNPFRKIFVSWIGWGWRRDQLLQWGFRFNGGGYLYGAAPYRYIRIGPIFIKKYV